MALSDRLLQEASSLMGVGDQLDASFLKRYRSQIRQGRKGEAVDKGSERCGIRCRGHHRHLLGGSSSLDNEGAEDFQALSRDMLPFSEIHDRHDLVSKIEKMKEKINSIRRSRVTYGIQDIGRHEQGTISASAAQSLTDRTRLRLASPCVEEPDLVGFQTDLETLIRRLTQGESRRSVISVVGMGGLGKTTVARRLHQSDAVKKGISISAFGLLYDKGMTKRNCWGFVMKRCMALSDQEQLGNMEKENAAELCSNIAEHLRGEIFGGSGTG
ncbi:hypothetical protein ACLOJK_015732 [Asimina triloba]